jgi:hypothetical protein
MSDKILDVCFEHCASQGPEMDIGARIVMAVIAIRADEDGRFTDAYDAPLLTQNSALLWAVQNRDAKDVDRLALFYIAHKAPRSHNGLPVFERRMRRKLGRICLVSRAEVDRIVARLINSGAIFDPAEYAEQSS